MGVSPRLFNATMIAVYPVAMSIILTPALMSAILIDRSWATFLQFSASVDQMSTPIEPDLGQLALEQARTLMRDYLRSWNIMRVCLLGFLLPLCINFVCTTCAGLVFFFALRRQVAALHITALRIVELDRQKTCRPHDPHVEKALGDCISQVRALKDVAQTQMPEDTWYHGTNVGAGPMDTRDRASGRSEEAEFAWAQYRHLSRYTVRGVLAGRRWLQLNSDCSQWARASDNLTLCKTNFAFILFCLILGVNAWNAPHSKRIGDMWQIAAIWSQAGWGFGGLWQGLVRFGSAPFDPVWELIA